MDSFHLPCNKLKDEYQKCFSSWFAECYMKGDYDDKRCAQKFDQYQKCLREGMQVHSLDIEDVLKPYLGTERMKK
ncbi:unnamed protein product [Macrosiphum euphorbiae]|uniref:TP53-regulated inhibitor of apoptosis 1 n=1 Tax=Macrosiphum euphorbiae TaxID=13131 RepID=A0AAV0WZ48_9HEMI|nr:unnamed protein product [Macrosiphum euphorbiae]